MQRVEDSVGSPVLTSEDSILSRRTRTPEDIIVSPMLGVFDITELRRKIFHIEDKRTLARCARVCRSWNDDALDHLWEKLDSSIPLLSILSPMTEGVSNIHVPPKINKIKHSNAG